MMNREDRIKEIIAKLTLEEKVSQLSYDAPAVEHAGIPKYNWWNECLHGVARAGLATVFPQAIALAATFDEDFIRKVAEAISDEGRAKYNEAVKQGNRSQYYGLTFWTPNINIFRDPRWGRGQETYGEDPYLTGRIGLAFMKGLQGDDPERLKVAACAKHYAVHSGPEKLRHVFNALVSKKDLFETYLPAFKLLVENGVEAVMGAYNRTLGEPCGGSTYLLKEILRGKWGFKGHVTSDCWAIRDFHEYHKVTKSPEESAAMALNAGCDLNCGCTYPLLTVSHKKGLVTEAAIDTALARLLRTRFKLGLFDPPERDPYAKLGKDVINCEKHRTLALEAARKSIVLLRNEKQADGSPLLPLDDSAKRILLIGPAAANVHTLLANYYGMSSRLVTILEGLTNKVKDKPAINFEYRQGSLMYEEVHLGFQAFGAAGHDDAPLYGLDGTDVVIACYGLDGAMEGEEGDAIASDSNGDRDAIELPPWQLNFLRRVRKAGKKVILILTGGSPIAFPDDLADAILFAWYPGEQGGNAVADIIFGDVNPSGKLPITFPQSTAQLPPYEDYAMKGRTYRYMTEKPLYPFGFGLSYSGVRFDSLELSAVSIAPGKQIMAAVTVTNTGSRDAEETVQIYVSRDDRTADDPITSLKAFRRAALPAGKTARIEIELDAAAFESVNAEGDYILAPGVYTVTAANAAPLPVSVEKGAARPVSAKITV
ncbi:MAG: glycoside hydrolase family 3 C-terminal domain-containing protein [Treponema sp.]|jgi:beta-glucosidase|nr:glycoside hydrolase family 3 C-terminal domain-containing protein [Treponema sp.]